MSTRVSIRDAGPSDLAALVAYNAAMAHETEGKALDEAVLTRGVRAVLDDDAKGRYIVAVADEAVVGQLMVTREWSDWRDGHWWWIQSVYVAPTWRRRGVYAALHDHLWRQACAMPLSGEHGVCGVRLYVEPDNVAAQATYAKLGMTHAYRVMELPRPR